MVLNFPRAAGSFAASKAAHTQQSITDEFTFTVRLYSSTSVCVSCIVLSHTRTGKPVKYALACVARLKVGNSPADLCRGRPQVRCEIPSQSYQLRLVPS